MKQKLSLLLIGLTLMIFLAACGVTAVEPDVIVLPTLAATAPAVTAEPAIATATAEAGVTPEPTAVITPTTTAPEATNIPVLNTNTQYIIALSDVNMRSGPGTDFSIIGWVANGQTAKVTGISSDGNWWRVICPDNTIGSCWVTARSQYTRSTNAPGSQPTATAVPTTCADAATFVADVTVPDNSHFAPNTGFVKSWRIKNSGTCTWNGQYSLVHASGSLLGAISSSFPLAAAVAPGQTIDLSVSLVAPATPGSYQSDWKLSNAQGTRFGVGRSSAAMWVKIVVPAPQKTIISGLIYQDTNQNGVYETGEPLLANREVQLVPGTACHVAGTPVAVTFSGADGRYTLAGEFNGSYCVGLKGSGGLDDVAGLTVTSGQSVNNLHLKAQLANGSITGWVWDDQCYPLSGPQAGNCVDDGQGGSRADGMIQPTEGYIAGVTVRLQAGSCATDNPTTLATAVTDNNGRYTFTKLAAGTYCVFINATESANIDKFFAGNWTFPQPGIWYHQITLNNGEQATPVNFGWDFPR